MCLLCDTLSPPVWYDVREKQSLQGWGEAEQLLEEWWLLLLNCQSNFWSSSFLGLLKRKGLKGGLEILYSSVVVEDNQARQPIDHWKCFLGNFQKELVQEWKWLSVKSHSGNIAQVQQIYPNVLHSPYWPQASDQYTEMFYHKSRISSDWKHS